MSDIVNFALGCSEMQLSYLGTVPTFEICWIVTAAFGLTITTQLAFLDFQFRHLKSGSLPGSAWVSPPYSVAWNIQDCKPVAIVG